MRFDDGKPTFHCSYLITCFFDHSTILGKDLHYRFQSNATVVRLAMIRKIFELMHEYQQKQISTTFLPPSVQAPIPRRIENTHFNQTIDSICISLFFGWQMIATWRHSVHTHPPEKCAGISSFPLTSLTAQHGFLFFVWGANLASERSILTSGPHLSLMSECRVSGPNQTWAGRSYRV